MPRTARLTHIASGLCGSFASRNNDLDGYWSIGKLRLLAEQYGESAVSLDLLMSSMQPTSSEFAPVLAYYRCLLEKLAYLSRIRLEKITTARITLDFAPSPSPKGRFFYQQDGGEQFVLTVAIHADGKAAGITRHVGYCRPHDPLRETRSTRKADC